MHSLDTIRSATVATHSHGIEQAQSPSKHWGRLQQGVPTLASHLASGGWPLIHYPYCTYTSILVQNLAPFSDSQHIRSEMTNPLYDYEHLHVHVLYYTPCAFTWDSLKFYNLQIEQDVEMKLISIDFFCQVAEGFRSSWLQTLGNWLINGFPQSRTTNRKWEQLCSACL